MKGNVDHLPMIAGRSLETGGASSAVFPVDEAI